MNTTVNDTESFNSFDTQMAILLCLIACFILFGNGLVVMSIKKFRYLHSPTNIYILFLAISDILVGLSLPYNAAFVVKRVQWSKNIKLCLTRYLFLTHGGATSVLLLLGLSLSIGIKHHDIR